MCRWSEWAARLVAVSGSVNVLDSEDWRAGPRRKDRNTALEADVRISHTTEQGFGEVIDTLARLVCRKR